MNINAISEITASIFILIGTLFSVLSAFGLIRLPDVYTRSHAATKSVTLGVLCTLIGTFLYFWLSNGFISVRLLLGIFFVFLTAPVAGHLICRAAYRTNVELAPQSIKDELKDDLHQEENSQM